MLFGLKIDDTNAKIGDKLRFIPITDLMKGTYILNNFKNPSKNETD